MRLGPSALLLPSSLSFIELLLKTTSAYCCDNPKSYTTSQPHIITSQVRATLPQFPHRATQVHAEFSNFHIRFQRLHFPIRIFRVGDWVSAPLWSLLVIACPSGKFRAPPPKSRYISIDLACRSRPENCRGYTILASVSTPGLKFAYSAHQFRLGLPFRPPSHSHLGTSFLPSEVVYRHTKCMASPSQ